MHAPTRGANPSSTTDLLGPTLILLRATSMVQLFALAVPSRPAHEHEHVHEHNVGHTLEQVRLRIACMPMSHGASAMHVRVLLQLARLRSGGAALRRSNR